ATAAVIHSTMGRTETRHRRTPWVSGPRPTVPVGCSPSHIARSPSPAFRTEAPRTASLGGSATATGHAVRRRTSGAQPAAHAEGFAPATEARTPHDVCAESEPGTAGNGHVRPRRQQDGTPARRPHYADRRYWPSTPKIPTIRSRSSTLANSITILPLVRPTSI